MIFLHFIGENKKHSLPVTLLNKRYRVLGGRPSNSGQEGRGMKLWLIARYGCSHLFLFLCSWLWQTSSGHLVFGVRYMEFILIEEAHCLLCFYFPSCSFPIIILSKSIWIKTLTFQQKLHYLLSASACYCDRLKVSPSSSTFCSVPLLKTKIVAIAAAHSSSFSPPVPSTALQWCHFPDLISS